MGRLRVPKVASHAGGKPGAKQGCALKAGKARHAAPAPRAGNRPTIVARSALPGL